MKLIKSTNPEYYLVNSKGIMIASSSITEGLQKLSKENCDKMFEIFDVRKLAREYVDSQPDDFKYKSDEYWNSQVDFKNGFNKAMELQKDKLFTIENMYEAIRKAKSYDEIPNHDGVIVSFDYSKEEIIQSLQQPTEIEIEIEMESTRPIHAMTDKGIKTFTQKEKLDENGCLILTKKK